MGLSGEREPRTISALLAMMLSGGSRGLVQPSHERLRLLELIRGTPGLHLRELQRRTGLGWGALAHHFSTLVRQRAVRVERNGRHLLAYAAGAAPLEETEKLALHGEARVIYDAIGPEGSTQGDLVASLGVSRQLVAYHLERLAEKGLVEVSAERPKRYRIVARAPDTIPL